MYIFPYTPYVIYPLLLFPTLVLHLSSTELFQQHSPENTAAANICETRGLVKQ
jgi:hypothetical protein